MNLFETPLTGRFLAHWTTLRGGRKVPFSRDFLDNPVPSFAPDVTVFDVEGDDMIIRLQGTRMVERWGSDKTGQSFFAANPLLPRTAIMANALMCVRQPCGVRGLSQFKVDTGRTIRVESLTLPLPISVERPHRLVNHSAFLDEIRRGEHVQGLAAMTFDWVDVGAGLPTQRPLDAR